MNNADKIIGRIKKEGVNPTSLWFLNLKNALVWFGFLLAVFLGALAFSVILLAIRQTDFNIISHLNHSRLELLLGLLPFIWLVLVVVFLGLAMLSVRYSRKGYKYKIIHLFTYSLFIGVALGTGFFMAGGSDRLERAFDINVLSYKSIEERKMQIWNNPKDGYLAGNIQQVNEEQIILEDFQQHNWQITFNEAFIARAVMLEPGEKIKIVGKISGSQQFQADEIRPWGGRGGQLNQ